MKKTLVLALSLMTLFSASLRLQAQDPATQQPSAEELEKQKEELKKNGYRLLDQVIDEAQTLRLPENRVRVQINAADLLWDKNQERARTLFNVASDGVIELMRSASSSTTSQTGPRQFPNQNTGRWIGLRQELVLAAARHDAPLAYQLLAATKNPNPQTNTADPRNPRGIQQNADDSLEQTLLGRIAALDPKLAAQNAEQLMEKGQFPRTVGEVINQLSKQDPEAAAKLADKTVKRIQGTNILTNNEAGTLAQVLLSPGPKLPTASTATSDTKTTTTQNQGRPPVLEQSAYVDLFSSVIDAALKATPQSTGTQQQRGGGGPQQRAQGGPGRVAATTGGTPTPPTDAQQEQNNARRLLGSLQQTLPMIDQYLPGRAAQVRQKLSEMGLADTTRTNPMQAFSGGQTEVTSDVLVQVAASTPNAQAQARLYQQAAYRALEEGNGDRARQIATEHLQAGARDSVIQRIEFREMAKKANGNRLDEIRQNLSRLSSDSERISMLLQIANDLKKDDPKAQKQVLEEARNFVTKRATNYQAFQDQLLVAHAFIPVDPSRSFEIIEPGIGHLNELLSAAQVLSGFEVNIFREGEMAIGTQGGNGLSSTITRFGVELAQLARTDFERAETLAGRFQFTEPRVMTRLTMVQAALGSPAFQPPPTLIRNFGSGPITIRQ